MQHLANELKRRSRKITPTERRLLTELTGHIQAGLRIMAELYEIEKARKHLGLRQVEVKSTRRKTPARKPSK